MSCGASGGANSDECKIDIHSQAPLQPRGALIRVFIQSFICRAKQACRPRKHVLTHTRTHIQNPLYPAYVNLECDGFILYLSLSPFQSWDKGVLYHLSCSYCSSDVWWISFSFFFFYMGLSSGNDYNLRLIKLIKLQNYIQQLRYFVCV